MNCDAYISLLNGHLDGINTAAEEALLHEHLKNCKECSDLLSDLEHNDALLKSCIAQPPADLTAKIMEKVRQTPKKRKKTAFYTSIAAAGLAAAAMFAVVISGNVAPLEKSDVSPASALDTAAPAADPQSLPFSFQKKSLQSAAMVLVVRADSAELSVDGEELNPESLPASVKNSGYQPDGSETAAYSVSYNELQRILDEYSSIYDASLYANADVTYTNGIIIFTE